MSGRKRKMPTKKPTTPYVIARCTQAGVHSGYLQDDGKRSGWVVLTESRRIWYWDGAASLDEIAAYGLNPARTVNSKIAAKIGRKRLRYADVCELIECSDEGATCLLEHPEWRA